MKLILISLLLLFFNNNCTSQVHMDSLISNETISNRTVILNHNQTIYFTDTWIKCGKYHCYWDFVRSIKIENVLKTFTLITTITYTISIMMNHLKYIESKLHRHMMILHSLAN